MYKIFLFIIVAFSLISCNKSESSIWQNNDDPRVYFPGNGLTLNTVWLVESDVFSKEIGIYCSGLRAESQDESIIVTVGVERTLIDKYNNDITQLYSGIVKELPAECYTLSANAIEIPVGKNFASIPVKFSPKKIEQLCPDILTKKYVIPLRLISTSLYKLHQDEQFVTVLYSVSLDRPRFLFYDNRNGVQTIGKKVVYGAGLHKEKFDIISFGVPSGTDYNMSVAYDPQALTNKFPGSLILPQSAYILTSTNLVYDKTTQKATIELQLLNDKIEFRKSYYLPLSISNTSSYIADSELKTLFIKVEAKNQYEKSYSSKLLVRSESNSRTGTYADTKDLLSIDKDIVQFQMSTNSTIAGAGATGTSSTYNNKLVQLKIIEATDKSKYSVELIKVIDASSQNSPTTLELTAGKTSYYDWNNERLVLFYRWKHSDGKWIEVEETMSSK